MNMTTLSPNLTETVNSTETNNLQNISEDQFHYTILSTILYVTVFIVGVIGNSLVIYVILRFSKMQTVTNMYIANLAIADEILIILIPIIIVTMYSKKWIFGDFICKTYMTVTGINQFISPTFLCIMSADRYVAVCHPISSPKWRTPKISKIVSSAAWIWGILLMLPLTLNSEDMHNPDTNFTTCVVFSVHTEISVIFTFYNFALGFVVPLSFILIFYFLVIKKLRTVGPQNKSKEKKKSHKKVTKLVFTVIFVYIVSLLPYWIMQLFLILNSVPEKMAILHLFASALMYTNSAVNPILYAFLSENFRKSFVRACMCASRKDTNGMLTFETSIFTRKKKEGSGKFDRGRMISLTPNTDENDEIPFCTKFNHSASATTMSSRLSTDMTGLKIIARKSVDFNVEPLKNGSSSNNGEGATSL